MEPDSSTDLSLSSSHHQVPINQAATSATKPLLAADERSANQSRGGGAPPANQRPEMEDDDDLELEQEKMFQNSKHFAQAGSHVTVTYQWCPYP
jgi:hypothetical protein